MTKTYRCLLIAALLPSAACLASADADIGEADTETETREISADLADGKLPQTDPRPDPTIPPRRTGGGSECRPERDPSGHILCLTRDGTDNDDSEVQSQASGVDLGGATQTDPRPDPTIPPRRPAMPPPGGCLRSGTGAPALDGVANSQPGC